jgi:hypothetical protein
MPPYNKILLAFSKNKIQQIECESVCLFSCIRGKIYSKRFGFILTCFNLFISIDFVFKMILTLKLKCSIFALRIVYCF